MITTITEVHIAFIFSVSLEDLRSQDFGNYLVKTYQMARHTNRLEASCTSLVEKQIPGTIESNQRSINSENGFFFATDVTLNNTTTRSLKRRLRKQITEKPSSTAEDPFLESGVFGESALCKLNIVWYQWGFGNAVMESEGKLKNCKYYVIDNLLEFSVR